MEYTVKIKHDNPVIHNVLKAMVDENLITLETTGQTGVIACYDSKSNKNLSYQVSLSSDGKYMCSCKGFYYNGKCWHVSKTKREK